jgi:hypothetical protein
VGEDAHDAEPVDVGERLVDETQLAELVGLEDGVRDGGADVGAGGAQVDDSSAAIGSTAVYINRG